jgi:hypothetical protein
MVDMGYSGVWWKAYSRTGAQVGDGALVWVDDAKGSAEAALIAHDPALALAR